MSYTTGNTALGRGDDTKIALVSGRKQAPSPNATSRDKSSETQKFNGRKTFGKQYMLKATWGRVDRK